MKCKNVGRLRVFLTSGAIGSSDAGFKMGRFSCGSRPDAIHETYEQPIWVEFCGKGRVVSVDGYSWNFIVHNKGDYLRFVGTMVLVCL